MSEPWRLLALPDLPPAALAAGFAAHESVTLLPLVSRDRAGLLAGLADAEIVLADWSATTWLNAEAFALAPHLAFVQQPSVGTDRVDLQAAAQAGVPVSNAGAANAVSVAEWCLTAALVVRRHVLVAERALAAGEWPQTSLPIRDLAAARVGILGFGPIGRLTADRFAALGCDVAYWSRTDKGCRYPRLEPAALAARSDVLVCLLPGAPGTRHLVDAALLAALPDGAVVVSAGRGSVVDEHALVAALRGGRISAALDVFETEPLPANSPLRALPNVLLSPHTAGSSREAQLGIITACQANITAVITGAPVRDVVNGLDPHVQRR